MKTDYVYGVPVFKFNRTIFGDEVDVFVSGGYHESEEDSIPPVIRTGCFDTITEYYDAVDELREEKRKNRSWAF